MPRITVQYAVPKKSPGIALLKRWANSALPKKDFEITIRIVSKIEMKKLNKTYRNKDKPTNVLSFPLLEENMLGDIVICADVVNQEASEQEKTPRAHWAHMVIHGVLHLQGYDHEKTKDALKMEAKEIRILKSLGFPNPYKIN